GLWAQWRLEEAGGGLREPGGSVLLSCRGSGFSFQHYGVGWYRQSPRGSLEWVSYISGDSSINQRSSAVEGRALVSRNNSRSESSLSLWDLHPQDSGRYFCTIHTG
ncbi:HVM33 protein, partial [Smithornis capensis]|nr:HVM33 protein [Smithornis capensis]